VQGEMNLASMTAPAKTDGAQCLAKPSGQGALRQREEACVRRSRVVLAVVATVKPSRRRHARQPARWREFREGEGGQKELGSRESAA